MITLNPSNVPYEKHMIEQFEKSTGLQLKKEYLEFLEKYNGGNPESNIVELDNEEIKSFSITTFFGVGIDGINDVIEQFSLLYKRVPKGCLPIARVEGGNIICLNLNIEKNGYVFLWNHETELLYEDDMTIEKLYPVADSFTEFLNKIKPYNPDEQDLSGYKVQEVWIDPDFLKEL